MVNSQEECPEIPTTPQASASYDTCILASGWFWHPQLQYQGTNGIARVVVGYTGGKEKNPTYQSIKDATEAYLIEYDPSIISYEKILDEWAEQASPFYPQKAQYRSAIFVNSEEQRMTATKKIEAMKTGGTKEIYAEIEDVGEFYRAEEYHQDFLLKQKSSSMI